MPIGAKLTFAYLGSGSRGNCALIASASTCVMLDCGFTLKETQRRLARLGVNPEDVGGVLVTHEHSDHIAGVGRFARRYGVPVWLTAGTLASGRGGDLPDARPVRFGAPIEIGDLHVTPVPVPHDAREPCQYVFRAGGRALGILTDLGHVTPVVAEAYGRCDALVVEANHDRGMLASGPYPPALKARVGGNWGHLNNEQAAGLLGHAEQARLQHLLAVHISEKNNTAELARGALQEAVRVDGLRVAAACQNAGSPWHEIV